ncbi:MAG: T9SS type A sorting domain-containing protein [Flavobacteriia bacterium]
MKKLLFCNCLYLLFLTNSFAQTITQEVNSSGGGFFSQVNASMQFNFGEVIIEDYQNNNCHLQQGFEQGYYGLLNVKETSFIQEISVYPNPTINTVKVHSQNNKLIKLEMLDLTGKTIRNYTFFNEIEIDVTDLSAGVYTLRIYYTEQTSFQNIKLIKHD